MCLVIDSSVFNVFFSHLDFEPAHKWVRNGPGKVIIGGSKYKTELRECARVLAMMGELEKSGRTVTLSHEDVDRMQRVVEATGGLHSNDAHIIAMVIVSGCKVVCTNDDGLQRDFRDKFRAKFGVPRPRVYKNRKDHMGLLCSGNIVAVCR